MLGGGQIKDIKFASDSTMLILWGRDGRPCYNTQLDFRTHQNTGTTHLLSITYRQSDKDGMGTEQGLQYSPHRSQAVAKGQISPPKRISNTIVVDQLAKYYIPCEKSFIPARLEIREQSQNGSNEDMRRIVVMGEDKLHYKVFKLPGQRKNKADGDTQMSS